jgi:hypothetical protein
MTAADESVTRVPGRHAQRTLSTTLAGSAPSHPASLRPTPVAPFARPLRDIPSAARELHNPCAPRSRRGRPAAPFGPACPRPHHRRERSLPTCRPAAWKPTSRACRHFPRGWACLFGRDSTVRATEARGVRFGRVPGCGGCSGGGRGQPRSFRVDAERRDLWAERGRRRVRGADGRWGFVMVASGKRWRRAAGGSLTAWTERKLKPPRLRLPAGSPRGLC